MGCGSSHEAKQPPVKATTKKHEEEDKHKEAKHQKESHKSHGDDDHHESQHLENVPAEIFFFPKESSLPLHVKYSFIIHERGELIGVFS